MSRRSIRVLGLVGLFALSSVSCKKDPPPEEDGDATTSDPRSGKRRKVSRLETIDLRELGHQPGFLADGPIYAAVKAERAQAFLRQLPVPADVAREMARAREEIGFDPLTDDVLARFAIPEDAVISMTLGRPVGREHLEAIRTGLRRDNRFLTNASRVINEQETAWDKGDKVAAPLPPEPPMPEPTTGLDSDFAVPPALEEPPEEPAEELAKPMSWSPEVAVAEPEPPPPEPPPPEVLLEELPAELPSEVPGGVLGGVPGGMGIAELPYDPVPPPISPAERREIDELLDHADATALQFHFHIPSKDPGKLVSEMRARMSSTSRASGDAYCRGYDVAVCSAGSRELVVVRTEGKAAVIDLLLFPGRFGAPTEKRRTAVQNALDAKPTKVAALEVMEGDASLYFDAKGWVDTTELEITASAVRRLSWSGDDPRSTVDRSLREAEAIRKLLDTARLFDGFVANVHHADDRTQLQASWVLRDGQKELAERALTPPPLSVPVPTLASLCDQSLACARTRGLPSPQRLGSELALGIYGSADALDDALDDADEAGVMLMFIATWPNALGTLLWQLPLGEARGAEAALVRGALDAVGRVQGLGASLRSLDVGRRSLAADYALYARVPASDLSLVSTALSMAEQRLTPTTVEGIDGEVMMLRIPEDDVPAVLMTREDQDVVTGEDGKEIRHGWLTLVDRPDRLAWLLGLATDDGEEPVAYGEIPDLWRLLSSMPEAIDELGFARTWASERSFKAMLELDHGQPRVVMEVARRQADAKGQ